MLSYMILFYCWTWCQTAKRITREIKSIPTLFTGLSNVIPPFVALTLIKTYGSWRSALRIWAGFSESVRVSPLSPPPPWPCQSTLHHHGNERPSGYAAVTGCRFTPAVTPTSSPPAGGMLGNWNRAKWAAVQHVRLSMGFHYPKQKQRVTLNNRFPSVSPQSNDSTLSLTWTWFSLEQP